MSEVNSIFSHQQLTIDGIDTHVVSAGDPNSRNTVVFLHGWPEDWSTFTEIMLQASKDVYAIAIDLPGIGGSLTPLPTATKSTIARHVSAIIRHLKLQNVTIVGHDIGGQVAYACLRTQLAAIKAIVIMNIVIPGLRPWDDVIKNPHIWLFAFHAVSGLPESLVAGKQARYFDYFYDSLTADPTSVNQAARRRYAAAYKTPAALQTGFDWYRAFDQDERENQLDMEPVDTPLLYLRGDKEQGDIAQYAQGFREVGVNNVWQAVISNSGHFTPQEQPMAAWSNIKTFINTHA